MKIKSIKLESGDIIVVNWNTVGQMAGWIETLFATSKNLKDCGILSALTLDPNDKIYTHGAFISPKVHCPVSYAMGEDFFGQYPGTREVETTLFICALIKKELVKKLPVPEKIGEDPFIDADYCLEASKLGFKTYATDELIVQYGGASSSGDTEQKYADNFDTAYKIFNDKWGRIYDHKMRLPVMYHTSVAQPSGFASAARGYIHGLTKNNIAVSYNYLRGTNEEEGDSEDEIINSICEDHGDLKMPQVIWAQAPYFLKNSGKYKIGHCEFEGDFVPPDWVKPANEMDELWVPTNWDREKFRRAGVNIPIYVIYQGIDKNYFHPGIAPMRFEIPYSFKFICNAAWDPRKNIPGMIHAFKNEFRKNEDVCLIIKTMNMGLTESVQNEVRKIKFNKDSANVIVKEEKFKPEALASFYTSGDCFLLPTHGEAWGLPLFEALACGVPVITTGYGAPNEILRDDKEKELPGVHLLRFQKALSETPYVYLQGNYWAEPSIPHLQERMRYVFEHREQEKKNALKTSELIRSKFEWSEVVKPIITRLQDIYKNNL